MLDVVKRAIDKFYIKKDYETFKELCKQPLELFEELKKYIELNKLKVIEDFEDSFAPSRTWHIHFNHYKKGNFEIAYKTILKISKVVPIYNIQHWFEVKHKNEEALTPTLCNVGLSTSGQLELGRIIYKILDKSGYLQLQETDLYEVVENLKDKKQFKSNLTINNLLFHDALNICHKPKNIRIS